jgi:polyhydroxybutyrate depolymerase
MQRPYAGVISMQRTPIFRLLRAASLLSLTGCAVDATELDAASAPWSAFEAGSALPHMADASSPIDAALDPSSPAADGAVQVGAAPQVDAGISAPFTPDASAQLDGSNAAAPVADAGPGSDAGAAACSGKPGAKRGRSDQTLSAAGALRSFVHYAPKNLDPNQPVPLVIVAHGTNMSGQGMFDITQYAALAEREKFVAVFPDGEDGPGSFVPWNVGDGVCGVGAFVKADGDDQAFLDELVKFAEQDQCLDHRHIFMTGFSMGGYFSNETSCVSSKVAAIAPHSAGTHDLSGCKGSIKPVILFHFKTDTLIDYECGTGARDQWVKRNGCSPQNPDKVNVKGGVCEYFKGCPAKAQVAMCSFDEPLGGGGSFPTGHAWSGGAKGSLEDFAAISETESATELGWSFFKKYAW